MSKYGITEKLTSYMDLLSAIGADDKGGVTRLLYTEEWIKAQETVKDIMVGSGFTTYYDAVGNMYGRIKGGTYADETVMIGSHIDTVKSGGKYDGQFGIVTGIVAAEYLFKTEGQPKRSIEVVSVAEEEGSRFPYTFWGVKNLLGLAKAEDVSDIVDSEGIKFVDAMNQAGFDFMPKDFQKRSDIKNFIEIHIEQGGVLEREKKPIGVVTAIVGQRRFNVEVIGQANHAGTTPMGYRKDAVYVASKMISNILDQAKAYGDPLVTTVGKMEVFPNVVNVVPGKVKFTIDIRHTDQNTLAEFSETVRHTLADVASENEVEFSLDMYMNEKPVPMDVDMVNMIQDTCSENGLNFKVMHSGAGHDAQLMAQHVPTAMFFVPSVKGISHSPAEFTALEDLVVGVEAVIDILKKLAY